MQIKAIKHVRTGHLPVVIERLQPSRQRLAPSVRYRNAVSLRDERMQACQQAEIEFPDIHGSNNLAFPISIGRIAGRDFSTATRSAASAAHAGGQRLDIMDTPIEITDEYMHRMLAGARTYCLAILRAGPNLAQPDAKRVIWEHGRRNFRLRTEGVLSIVCPVVGGVDILGLYIFDATKEETHRIMDDDPGVQAGIFVYEAYLCRGFPGDRLAP